MWQEQSAQQFIGNGLVDADTIKIFIPDTATDIRKDDMVVRQTVTEITDEIIKAARTVRAVSIFDYGTPEMRHIEAVV
jgi:L-rhamnose isomerase